MPGGSVWPRVALHRRDIVNIYNIIGTLNFNILSHRTCKPNSMEMKILMENQPFLWIKSTKQNKYVASSLFFYSKIVLEHNTRTL